MYIILCNYIESHLGLCHMETRLPVVLVTKQFTNSLIPQESPVKYQQPTNPFPCTQYI